MWWWLSQQLDCGGLWLWLRLQLRLVTTNGVFPDFPYLSQDCECGGDSGVAAGHRLLALLEWVLSLKLQWLAGLSDNAGFVIRCCLAVLGCVVEWCWVCVGGTPWWHHIVFKGIFLFIFTYTFKFFYIPF